MENNNSVRWLKRRLKEPDILSHMEDIILEGFDYTKPCDFVNDYDFFLQEILVGSALTFINGFDEYLTYDDDLLDFTYTFMKYKFENLIKENYNDEIEFEECGKNITESINKNKKFIRERNYGGIDIFINKTNMRRNRLTERDITRAVKKTLLEYGSVYDDQQREEMFNTPREKKVPTKEELEGVLTNIFGRFSREGMSDSDMYDVISSWSENYFARINRR
jgi:hypothetical protein